LRFLFLLAAITGAALTDVKRLGSHRAQQVKARDDNWPQAAGLIDGGRRSPQIAVRIPDG
jgi:hypothetical protein